MKKGKKSKKVRGAAIEETTVDTPEREIVYVNDIAVQIDDEVYEKVMHWITKADGEISGLGKIVVENGVFRVTSAMLLKQENTSVTTEFDGAAVGKAMFELKDEPGTLNWWWHSHVNMDVFWSGTDMDTIHEIGAGGWVVATVLNKSRESRTCYYQKGAGFIPALVVDDIPTTIISNISEELTSAWDKEFDANVTTKKISRSYYNGMFPSRYWGEYAEEEDERPGKREDDERDVYSQIIDASTSGYRSRHSQAGFATDEFEDLEEKYSPEEIQAILAEEIRRQEKKNIKKAKGMRR